ncbi:MAG: hypothetical protein PHQ66_03105 [Candidatus Nanoarchaeia archaeon]|nr:hypothetical protein [Candidatus Nanoarchaeia archaeon]MDD5357645.1 hypothetical protein [Candidatus Nanoarchaeia archaeon]MDD5588564.1 hypothetical protein [Candidatus Nanoarchaeia archaeon]
MTITLDKKTEICPLINKCKSYYDQENRTICHGENKYHNYKECVAYDLNRRVKEGSIICGSYKK